MDDDIFAHMGHEFNGICNQTGKAHPCPDDSFPLIELERQMRHTRQGKTGDDKPALPNPARG